MPDRGTRSESVRRPYRGEDTSWPTYEVSGTRIAALTPDDAARLIVARAGDRVREVHLCNTYTLSEIDRDPRLRDALRRADLNLPDGAPVAWLGRRHGITTSVRGPDLVLNVMREGVECGLSHYLYGGAPGVADRMRIAVEDRIPGVKIANCECPPYRELDDTELADLGRRIDASGSGIVWIGLGTPKQDYLVARLSAHTSAAVIPVGAAFNFISGDLPEAPRWLHGSGLEWSYRLMREPARLWRRYLIGGPRFAAVAAKYAAREWRGRTRDDRSSDIRCGAKPIPAEGRSAD